MIFLEIFQRLNALGVGKGRLWHPLISWREANLNLCLIFYNIQVINLHDVPFVEE